MLQQTRVEAVIPYYRRFLERFPDLDALASATEDEVLACWSGLGYYSRGRNLHKAARRIAAEGTPDTYEAIRALPGAGPYTTAAIGSIAFGLPYAAVDGNVVRVLARLTDDPSEIGSPQAKRVFAGRAQELLDPARPGDFNQAMMELGATVCVPAAPRCGQCPVAAFCDARMRGTERQLPVRLRKSENRHIALDPALVERDGMVFLVRRDAGESRLAGFWELPDKRVFGRNRPRLAAEFAHQIVNDRFRVRVWRSKVAAALPEGRWFLFSELVGIPLSTIARKAITACGVVPENANEV